MAVAVDILKVIFWRIPEWLLKRRKLLIAGLIILVIIIGIGQYHKATTPATPVPTYQQTVPQTFYVGITPSRVYYINSYKLTNTQAILTDYFTYDTKWVRQIMPLPILADQIKITKR